MAGLAASVVLGVAGFSTSVAIAADTPAAKPEQKIQISFEIEAPESDYPAFRALNVPARLIDINLVAIAAVATRNKDAAPDVQARDRQFVAAMTQILTENREVFIDTMMHSAFHNFSHSEVERLTKICALPPLQHLRAWQIEQEQRDGDAAQQDVRDYLETDADFQAMPATDRRLLLRFLDALSAATDAVAPLKKQFGAVMVARWEGKPEPVISAPEIRPNQPPNPPLTHPEALYLNGVGWMIPWDTTEAFVTVGTGDLVLDCGVKADGKLVDCEAVRNTLSGSGVDALIASFNAEVHADADTVKAGIPAGARMRFTAHITAKPASS